jgi:hypothetical protein
MLFNTQDLRNVLSRLGFDAAAGGLDFMRERISPDNAVRQWLDYPACLAYYPTQLRPATESKPRRFDVV